MSRRKSQTKRNKQNRNKQNKKTMTISNNMEHNKGNNNSNVVGMERKERVLPKGMAHDKALLLSVFHIQNPSRNRACNDHAMKTIEGLAPEGCTVVRNKGNMLIRKGDASGPHPYYMAHMDQVHNYQPHMKVRVSGNLLHATDGNERQCGVGGDDKCGIYVALMMLHTLEHCTAVFVRDEEVGCLGSNEVPLEWFTHAAFVIQADRNNTSMDIICDTNGMTCASNDFMHTITSLPICRAAGHTEAYGTITDIGELAERGLEVSMINVSSGYHNAHTNREIVKLDELSITLAVALQAAEQMGSHKWDHIPEGGWYTSRHSTSSPSSYGGVYGGGWSFDDDGADGSDSDSVASRYMKGDVLTEEEIAQALEDMDDKDYREAMIRDMVSEFGFDRNFDVLDSFETSELESYLEELRWGVIDDRDSDALAEAEEDDCAELRRDWTPTDSGNLTS